MKQLFKKRKEMRVQNKQQRYEIKRSYRNNEMNEKGIERMGDIRGERNEKYKRDEIIKKYKK